MELPLDLGLSNLSEFLGLSPSSKGTQPKDDAKEPSGSVSPPRKTFDILERLPTPPRLKDLRNDKEHPTQLLPLTMPSLGSPDQQTKTTPSASTSPIATPSVRFTGSTDEKKEDELHQAWKWVENYQCIFQLLMGLVIILYGHFFPMTLLVVQGMFTAMKRHSTLLYPTFNPSYSTLLYPTPP